MDFKDVSSVPADPLGKQQHVVEVFNFVDAGTSILLDAQVQADFHAASRSGGGDPIPAALRLASQDHL
jgi:hypothetical protein